MPHIVGKHARAFQVGEASKEITPTAIRTDIRSFRGVNARTGGGTQNYELTGAKFG